MIRLSLKGRNFEEVNKMAKLARLFLLILLVVFSFGCASVSTSTQTQSSQEQKSPFTSDNFRDPDWANMYGR